MGIAHLARRHRSDFITLSHRTLSLSSPGRTTPSVKTTPTTFLSFALFVLLLHLSLLPVARAELCEPDWGNDTRRWIGPRWWAHPLQDWQLVDGAAEALALPNRVLSWFHCDVDMSSELKAAEKDLFFMRVDVTFVPSKGDPAVPVAGFRVGMRGPHRHFLSAALDTDAWLDARLSGGGLLSIGKNGPSARIPKFSSTFVTTRHSVTLGLRARRVSPALTLLAFHAAANGQVLLKLRKIIPARRLSGSVAFLASTTASTGMRKMWKQLSYAALKRRVARVRFANARLFGPVVRRYDSPTRAFGPLLWTQYTLSRGTMRMLVHVAPIGRAQVDLFVAGEGGGEGPGEEDSDGVSQPRPRPQPTPKALRFRKVRSGKTHPVRRTVRFNVGGWYRTFGGERRYVVRVRWGGKYHRWRGVVRAEPVNKRRLKVGVFSCDHGYMFPHAGMVADVRRLDPDMLFFAGDQIYESVDGVRLGPDDELDDQVLDFLRRFWRFGLTWRHALADRPSILLPDDHDVFQGNLWGGGGVALPRGKHYQYGGYVMPGAFVSVVEHVHVAHLPLPYWRNATLPMGTRPFFTALNYAGVGFAVLEDRKFKTGPKTLPARHQHHGDTPAAHLLGPVQEGFLHQWASDWSGAQSLKVALSATVFAKATTHGTYALKRTDKIYSDTGAWPRPARDRAVRLLARARALTLHGDQHLGMLLKLKQPTGRDVVSFMVPGTANGWPRAWWPGIGNDTNAIRSLRTLPQSAFTGKFTDDAGNRIKVLAVANPQYGSNTLRTKTAATAFRKASGFGLVSLDKTARTATIYLYRTGRPRFGMQFPGFPVVVRLGGKPTKRKQKHRQKSFLLSKSSAIDDGIVRNTTTINTVPVDK